MTDYDSFSMHLEMTQQPKTNNWPGILVGIAIVSLIVILVICDKKENKAEDKKLDAQKSTETTPQS